MTWVNDKDYIRYSGNEEGETVNMIDSYSEDGNDHINLKKLKEPTTIVGGNGKDKIWGSTKHMNYIFGDNVWGFDYGEDIEDYNSYSGKDTIYGGNAADFIHGGLANDKMYGQDGVNIFQFKKGDGNDTIVMGKGDDYLYFCDSDISDLSYTQKNKDLIVKYSDTDQVTIKDYYKTFGHVSLKGIADKSFDINTIIKGVSDILEDYNGTSEWQLTRIENRVEDYLERALKNLPTPKSLYEKTGLTIIRTKGGESKGTDASDVMTGSNGRDKLYGKGGNDTINGGKGNDTLDGGKGNDRIDGGKGNDKIYAGSGKNLIIGNKGNDKIYAGTGADTFVYAKGAGKDTLYKAGSKDTIRYKDVNAMKDLKFEMKRNNLVITRKNGIRKETITLSDFFKSEDRLDKIVLPDGTTNSILKSAQVSLSDSGTIDGTMYNETIKGSFRADVIYGRGGNDKITGHKGKDTIDAGSGVNSIYFGKNDGDDVVISGGGTDTLVFKKQKLSDLKGKFSGNNAIIFYKGGTVTLKNYKKGHSVQFVKTGSTITNIEDLMPYNKIPTPVTSTSVTGTDIKDKITADFGITKVNAKGGSDLIYVKEDGVDITAGKGNDIIKLYSDEAIIHFNKGDGADKIQKLTDADYLSQNTLIFEGENNVSGLNYTATSNGYKITYNGGADSVTTSIAYPSDTAEDYFGLGNEGQWDVVKLNNGTDYLTTKKGLLRNYFAKEVSSVNSGDEADYVSCSATSISTKGGDDYISLVSDEATQITAGQGDDNILISAKGNRTFNFNNGDGNDIIYDENIQLKGSRSDEIVYKLNNVTSIDNVTVTREGSDIKISYGTSDSILIKDVSDGGYIDIKDADFGYIQVGNDKYAIVDRLPEESDPDDPDTDTNNAKSFLMDIDIGPINEAVAGYTNSKSSDISNQLFEENKQDSTTLVNTIINKDAYAFA